MSVEGFEDGSDRELPGDFPVTLEGARTAWVRARTWWTGRLWCIFSIHIPDQRGLCHVFQLDGKHERQPLPQMLHLRLLR
jgi:hypothetical protein